MFNGNDVHVRPTVQWLTICSDKSICGTLLKWPQMNEWSYCAQTLITSDICLSTGCKLAQVCQIET